MPEDLFDQAAVLDIFDQAAEPQRDIFDEAEERPSGELSSRFLASAAQGGLNALAMASRVGAALNPLTKVGDFLAEKTGGITSKDFVTETEGAAARARDDYGVDPKFDKGLLSAVASGAGSMVPILASGGTLAPVTGAVMAGEQGLQEAEQAGVSGPQKVISAAGNAAVAFVSEKLLGLPALLKSARASKIPTNTFKGLVKSIVAQAGKSFFREGTQETLEQVASDTIAKHIAAYDPERKIFDPDKLGTTFLAGGIVGGGVGGGLQLAQDVAPKEQMQEMAESIDQSLARTLQAEPPPISEVTPPVRATPQGTPILSPEEIQAVPEAQPGEVPVEVPQATEFVGTAINTPEGLVTKETGTAHPEMLMEALDKGLPEPEVESNLGFAFKRPDGQTEWVDRVEAGRRLTESGQLTGLPEGTPLTSEHIRNEVEGVRFTQTPVTDANTVATQLQQFRNQGISTAKSLGATDLNAEDIVSDAQREIAQQIASGKSTGQSPKALFMQAVKNNTANAVKRETALKRGGGKVVSGDVESEEGSTLIEQASTPVGPRSTTVSQEDISLIDQAISKLPENQSKVMRTLADNPDLTDKELSAQLGLTIDQVKKAKSQARASLLQYIQDNEIGKSMGPGAASASEILVQYEERKFGKRFQESEDIAPEVRARTGDRYYEPIPNRVTAQRATELIELRGDEDVQKEIQDERTTISYADRSTVGQILIKKYNDQYKAIEDKKSDEALKLLDKAAELAEWAADFGTRLGQGVQSFAMWDRLSPDGKLRAYEKMVKKKRDNFTRGNRNDIDEIKDTLAGATKESATKASGGQKAKAKIATAKRGTGADKPIWDQYKEDLSKRMASLLPGQVPSKERGPLEKFTNQVFQLFRGKVTEPSGPKTKPPNIVRVRQMISEWSKLKEAWREAWVTLRDTDVAEHRVYIDMVSNYLDAPFTEGDIRSAMGEMPIFSPSRLGQLSESTGRTSVKEVADVLLDENPNATKEMRSKIEDYAQKIIESERSKYQEVKAKAEASKKEKSKPQSRSLDRDVWVQYQQQAIKNLETALFGGKPNEQSALQEFTNRLVNALKGSIPAKITEPKTAQEKKAEDIRVIREAMTNREKYEEVWTNTSNSLKLRYGNRPDILNKIDEVFAGGLKTPLNPKTLQSLIRERIKSDEIKLSELVRRHYSKLEASGKSLADKISSEIGLDESGSIEVANVIEAEFAAEVTKTKARALASLVKTNPTAKKLSKGNVQKLIELSNLGALTDRTFYDAVSESLGLPEYTPDVQREILRLAHLIDEAPEGMPKMEATLALSRYLAQQKGFDPSDLLFGVYYGNILSGTGTQAVNLMDTTLNVLNETFTLAIQNPKAASQITAALARGAASGRFDAMMAIMKGRKITDGKFVENPFFMETAKFGKKGGVPLKTDTRTGRIAKRLTESKLATPLNLGKFVGRLMSASDALAFRAAQEAKSAQLAWELANNGDQSIDQILGYDRIQEFQGQAKSEGYTGAQAQARASELMIMSRPVELQRAATDFASEGTYNVKPYGTIGVISNSIESLSRRIPAFKLIVPFTRIVGNVLNRGLNNSPYGYYRALRGKAGTRLDPKTFKEYSPEERNALMIRATASMAVITMIAVLHQTGAITISGAGPSDPEKKRQLRQTGWKPYTIKIGDRYYSYAFTPWAIALAATGNYMDNAKYQDFESKEGLDRAAYVFQAISGSLFNQSFLTGLSNFFDILGEKNPSAQINALRRWFAQTASSIAVPLSGFAKDVEYWTSGPFIPKVESMKQALISQIPFASQTLRPQLNALGEPILANRGRFQTPANQDPVWKLIADKGLRVPVPNTFFDNPEEQYQYLKEQGGLLRKWIETNSSRLKNMDTKNAQDALENAADAYRSRTRTKFLRKGALKKVKKGEV